MILRTQKITKRFGGITALDAVSTEFRPGSITALVGSNGAGKSTLFNVMGGLIRPDEGEVVLSNGADVHLCGLPAHSIAQKGVGMLFQDVRPFRKLTALENVSVAVPNQPGEHPWRYLFHHRVSRDREREVAETSMRLLEFVGLADKASLWPEQLSYGQQKLVALARLLAADSKVLLLDEPTSGVHPDRIDQLLDRIRRLAEDHNRTVVLIEHNQEAVARVCDYVYHLERGQIVNFGSTLEILGSLAGTSYSTAEGRRAGVAL